MFRFFKHISPKTKLLFLASLLILFPSAILGYLGLQSVDQKAESLRANYRNTATLVRERMEREILRLEDKLRLSLATALPKPRELSDLAKWLQAIEAGNPGLEHLVVVRMDGGLKSALLSHGWTKANDVGEFATFTRVAPFLQAEEAEYLQKDFSKAISLYEQAFASASSLRDRALLHSRIGRCHFKSGNYLEGIQEYRKLLRLKVEEPAIGLVPASVIALSQMADGYSALNRREDRRAALSQLHRYLLDHPWDLEGGEYLYYLKSSSQEVRRLVKTSAEGQGSAQLLAPLLEREQAIVEQAQLFEIIPGSLLPRISSDAGRTETGEGQPHHISHQSDQRTYQLGYLKLPMQFHQWDLVALVFQMKDEFIISTLLPNILENIDLGRDVLVGIVNGMDSVLFPLGQVSLSSNLVIENFSELLPNWKVALFDRRGNSIDELVRSERRLYLALLVGVVGVMLVGIVLTVRAAAHELEIARIRTDFVSSVSHELKTPLSLIRMFGETLETGLVTDEAKRKEFYTIIRKETERLTHLINNVLDFSKIDAGSKEYHFEEADLVEVVRNTVEAYKIHVRDLGFTVEAKYPEHDIKLAIDSDAISQTLLNLLSNATKYSEDRKRISVEVEETESWAVVSVKDQGVGIAKESLTKIFDRFYRVPNEKTRETPGTGLGLTLAKHIIEAHHGSVQVESKVGEGSTFTVRLPMRGIS